MAFRGKEASAKLRGGMLSQNLVGFLCAKTSSLVQNLKEYKDENLTWLECIQFMVGCILAYASTTTIALTPFWTLNSHFHE